MSSVDEQIEVLGFKNRMCLTFDVNHRMLSTGIFIWHQFTFMQELLDKKDSMDFSNTS